MRRFLNKCWAYPDEVFPDDAIDHIEGMFAPYLRGDFPRESYRLHLLTMFGTIIEIAAEIEKGQRGAFTKEEIGQIVDAYLPGAERLWNGAQLPDKIGQLACPYHGGLTADMASCSCGKVAARRPGEPACLTCGGSDEVCQSYRMQNCDLQGTGWDPRKCGAEISAKRCSLGVNYLPEPCPDCKPCETCGGSKRVPRWPEFKCNERCKITEHWKPCTACAEEPEVVYYRSGTAKGHLEQRKGKESKSVQYYPGGTDQDSYAAFSYHDWRYRPDRREGDRRSKILAGGLKAMRPQE